jgi:hypothetical protein
MLFLKKSFIVMMMTCKNTNLNDSYASCMVVATSLHDIICFQYNNNNNNNNNNNKQ